MTNQWLTVSLMFALCKPFLLAHGSETAFVDVGKICLARTEVSVGQYCLFLNACARFSDPKKLWNPLMQDSFMGGITRVRIGDVYRYDIKSGYEKKPVTHVSWCSAVRYCNWLSYGCPDAGVSILGTTEGSDKYGVYDTRHIDTLEFINDKKPIKRGTVAPYFLPTAEEWRQAADRGGQGIANVYVGCWRVPFPHLFDVDSGVTNRFGIINMRGNVAEWVESRVPGSTFFMALGGSFIRGCYSLDPDYREGDEPDKPVGSFGFRVASSHVPRILPRPDVVQQNERLTSGKGEEKCQTWCCVGFPGNSRDPLYKTGRVNYEFEISKYALTCEEWCEFLNAVCNVTDPYGLWNPDMETGVCGGIARQKAVHGYRYVVKVGWERRPVVYIGYKDAMRYCNWLHYGKPKGDCVLGVTEGNKSQGAYNTENEEWHRNYGAKYFIPTDAEWCKAAYYDPVKRGMRKYWDYPCRTSDVPPNEPTEMHGCNYLRDGCLSEKGPFWLATVDSYPNSETYFGCRQMAGNIWEWVEPVGRDKMNLRGGSFGYTEFGMGIWNRDEAGVNDELHVFGMRIARAVPGQTDLCQVAWTIRLSEFIEDMGIRRLTIGMTLSICAAFTFGWWCGKIRR